MDTSPFFIFITSLNLPNSWQEHPASAKGNREREIIFALTGFICVRTITGAVGDPT